MRRKISPGRRLQAPHIPPLFLSGLRADGIRLLLEAKQETGLPIVTESMDLSQLDLFADVDIIQVGARNMQNFEMLRQLASATSPFF